MIPTMTLNIGKLSQMFLYKYLMVRINSEMLFLCDRSYHKVYPKIRPIKSCIMKTTKKLLDKAVCVRIGVKIFNQD